MESARNHPLSLGRDARARVGGAVRALLDVAGLQGASDAVRLAVVVIASRTPSETGVVEIRTGELGRWLGLSASYVASEVLPALRGSGVVSVVTGEGEFGQDTGLECRVLPLWAAQDVVGHPLALAKKELAVLLRLLEAVMAPGWTLRDGRVIPAGLLGTRTGRGAATDRLALLRLVLEARETGQVRQCGGTVDTKRGRAAATVARLLGCKVSRGERVLERLEERGLVRRVRRQTVSGLAHRSRLIVPAVAAAHGYTGTDAARGDRAEAPIPVFSEPDVTAGASGSQQLKVEQQVSDAPVDEAGTVAEPDVAAPLHTDHSLLGTLVSPLSLSGGFSGEARRGSSDLPDRACVREDGPLRGEQPKKSPSISSHKPGPGRAVGAPVRVVTGVGQSRQQRGRVPAPPMDLRTTLAPVDLVWARLNRPAARRLVEAATRDELVAVTGFAGRTDGPQVLADRLARRLEEQLRHGGPIKDPVGWLLAKGLPQRQECGDVRCDDRLLLDSGRDCPRCEDRQATRRAQRSAVAAEVDAAMPAATEAERRTATTQRLHQEVTAEAWERTHSWGQHPAWPAAGAAHARTEPAAAEPAGGMPVATTEPVTLPVPRSPGLAPEPEYADVDEDQELVLEDLTREQVRDWRNRAAADHQLVFDHIDAYGERSAKRLFTRAFVAQVQRLSGLDHLDLGYSPWGQV